MSARANCEEASRCVGAATVSTSRPMSASARRPSRRGGDAVDVRDDAARVDGDRAFREVVADGSDGHQGMPGGPPLRWAFSSARLERGVRDTVYRRAGMANGGSERVQSLPRVTRDFRPCNLHSIVALQRLSAT